MDIAAYLNALIALFVIIDPIGAALIFHSLVPPDDMAHRFKMALKAGVISFALLVLFGNFGEPLLHKLGISIDALRISGGILLFYTAFNMITKDMEYTTTTERKDIAVFPMSIPLMAGPGSLTLAILLYSKGDASASNMAVTLAILSITVSTFLLMMLSRYVKRIIGRTGDDILRRFLGVILAALAIQFVHDGVVNMSV
ncbi:MarC family protein [Neptunomonas sp. XY-337]|uniref:MarC family protein n=1 Tax=Neptunomonas sp. XY-337 TaxID=2561897 RepID=UPI0010AA9964|nr:MarC family protein [Neptunomonas sp. XY-337]